MTSSKVDWERLCEHPFIKVGHRIAAMLLVPIMLTVGYTFVDMRDTIKSLLDKLKTITVKQDSFNERQNDFDDRLKFIERRDWMRAPQ